MAVSGADIRRNSPTASRARESSRGRVERMDSSGHALLERRSS